MTDNYIIFQQERDLGEIISDTFKFIRGNYKALFGLIFKIAGPSFLVLTAALAYYSYLGGETFGNPFLTTNLEGQFLEFFISMFIMLLSLLIFFVFLNATVLHFIKSYIINKGIVNKTEVIAGVRHDFARLMGLMILCSVVCIFGLMLCILPGIYLWAPLSLAPAIFILGRFSSMDSFTESFSLIRDNWWITFFSLVVMVVLVYIIGLIFQIPLFIYFFIKMITVVQEVSAADPSSMFDWVYVVFSVIASLAQYLLSVILIIATSFIYINLDEKKNATGSYEIISNLGSQEEN